MKVKIWLIAVLITAAACNRSYTPKPTGYLRVDYPDRKYVPFDQAAPYTFEVPAYAEVVPHQSDIAEPFWYDVNFPPFDGTLYLSYKQIEGDVNDYIEDSRSLVYKHASRSDGIRETPFMDSAGNKYGILYDLAGNVASSVQFFLTDSTEHFLRGSLYFNATPNSDSLRPIIRFVKQDIEHMIETVQWKE